MSIWDDFLKNMPASMKAMFTDENLNAILYGEGNTKDDFESRIPAGAVKLNSDHDLEDLSFLPHSLLETLVKEGRISPNKYRETIGSLPVFDKRVTPNAYREDAGLSPIEPIELLNSENDESEEYPWEIQKGHVADQRHYIPDEYGDRYLVAKGGWCYAIRNNMIEPMEEEVFYSIKEACVIDD